MFIILITNFLKEFLNTFSDILLLPTAFLIHGYFYNTNLNFTDYNLWIKKYIIITPVKNEEKYIRYKLDSVIAQTVLPEEWIVVDDGSSDNTSVIVEEDIENLIGLV